MASNERILDRVQKLLNIAEHPNTPAAEAEVALAQAQSLITKHAIDEALLRQTQTTAQRRAPEKRDIPFASGISTIRPTLRTILQAVCRVNRCSVALTYAGATVYGASEDIAWVEMLMMSIHHQLLAKLNPKWDTSKSYDENVYNFKVAGYKWKEINREAVKNGQPDARKLEKHSGALHDVRDYTSDPNGSPIWEPRWAYDKDFLDVEHTRTSEIGTHYGTWMVRGEKISGKMITAYRRHARAIGDTNPVATQSHEVYRLSYLDGFTNEMLARLWRMEQEGKEAADSIPGAALALVSFDEEVKAMFYAENPEYDPEVQRQRREAAAQARAEMLAAMSEKERYEFLEREERDRRRAAKRIKYYSPDSSAQQRGSSAAKEVDLTRKAGSAHAGAERGQLR